MIELLLPELCRGEECCPRGKQSPAFIVPVGEMMEATVNQPVCNYCILNSSQLVYILWTSDWLCMLLSFSQNIRSAVLYLNTEVN